MGEEEDLCPPARTARNVMRTEGISVVPGESLARAAGVMDSAQRREVAVVDGGALVGILTRTDMEPYRGHFEWTAVRAAMNREPVTVAPDAPLGDVMSLLLERGFNGVPVCAGGQFLGMISRSDVLRAVAQPD
jgi:CBS domain-containing protein